MIFYLQFLQFRDSLPSVDFFTRKLANRFIVGGPSMSIADSLTVLNWNRIPADTPTRICQCLPARVSAKA